MMIVITAVYDNIVYVVDSTDTSFNVFLLCACLTLQHSFVFVVFFLSFVAVRTLLTAHCWLIVWLIDGVVEMCYMFFWIVIFYIGSVVIVSTIIGFVYLTTQLGVQAVGNDEYIVELLLKTGIVITAVYDNKDDYESAIKYYENKGFVVVDRTKFWVFMRQL
jgi:hypothetical protein